MPSSSGEKATMSYTPPAGPAQGPPVYTPPPADGQGYPPQQSYASPPPPQGYPPQQNYAPAPQQGYAQQPVYSPQPQPTPAQVGENYRAQLFAQCAQGQHSPTTKYGVCGIITAVVCFPIGLICLFIDTEQRCDRCGIKLS
ncbi:hypothetical protein MIND_01023600 [Mycena indigotica]|uniref:Brain protein I3 n=1 Tax=Mycena indigotica TaxID=2126181 RepID=A0A8H6VUY6_9AGAR|nr:uncharacterized protein MIND_01023600 [Mycena indigotica]KAF7294857.1 hypothetical protein MIND_01023600 [Mycena indigotica]